MLKIRGFEFRVGLTRGVSTALLTTFAMLLSAACGTSSQQQAGAVSLTLMSVAQGPGLEGAWADLIKAYEQQNPNVTVTRNAVPYANYRTSVKLRASAPDAPDLVEGDMGPGGVMASLIPGGLLLPLDKYAAQYGWRGIYGSFIQQLQLSSDGKLVGNGSIYGIPDFAELLGFFYNKSLLAKLNLQPPATFADFEASLAAAKSAGITPIMIGGSDQFPWSHIYDVLADHFGDPQQLINWFRGVPGTTIVTPGMMQAATVLQQWVSAGYFEKGANGVSDGDAVTKFDTGGSLYKLDGPWATQQNLGALGSNLDFMLLPPETAGTFPASTGWMGWSVGVTAKSKHQDAAAAFMNFMTSPSARTIFLNHDNPAGTPGPEQTSTPVDLTVGNLFSKEVTGGTLVPYMDVAYPQAAPYDLLANSQAMAAGKMTPATYLTTTQKGWATYHGYSS
jgi:raffinose/stachyose/melibiose transport system substrate-binding protein